ncbi:hypothetical protein HO173_005595 [Letharia columbiana]|uniref:Uncharacterized protein n=1 Tax=Letharia columbiana TaxID=112416 RepID=A0A8H6FWE8_9LECA|nr:uncharacterized protein HO173_005595 [Letharia columbiana]KAF6235967.1 hypothetical protein HO173_005595 [Letharia columbiana]
MAADSGTSEVRPKKGTPSPPAASDISFQPAVLAFHFTRQSPTRQSNLSPLPGQPAPSSTSTPLQPNDDELRTIHIRTQVNTLLEYLMMIILHLKQPQKVFRLRIIKHIRFDLARQSTGLVGRRP